MGLRAMLLVVLSTAATAGCHECAGRPRGTGTDAARRELEHPRVRDTTDRDFDDLQEATEEVRREREDVAEAAARARGHYKKLLAKEIGSAEKRLGELERELARTTGTAKSDKERDISAARAWRTRLRHDLEELDRVGESEWPDLKERIEHDLEAERPAAVPRSLDKSYAI